MRSDERGQMMLLAAIVLLIAFVSLAVMVARVTLVANETTRDTHGAFLREAEAVAAAIDMIEAATDVTEDFDAYEAFVSDLQAYEAQRGFLLSWECNDSEADADNPTGDDTDFFRLTDGRSIITIEIEGPIETPADNNDDCTG